MTSKTPASERLFATLLLAVTACKGSTTRTDAKDATLVRAPPAERHGIVGGTEVRSGDVVTRSTVAILRGRDSIACTGTLVGPSIILSAAHCFDGGVNRDDLWIGFGLDVPSARKFKIDTVVTHERYVAGAPLQEKDPLFDLALVRFVGVAPDGAVPARLAAPSLPLPTGTPHVLAGFGFSWTSNFLFWRRSGGAGTLRRVDLALTEDLVSSKQLKFTSSERKAVCSGDSGGPSYIVSGDLVTVTGVTSWGYANCERGLSVFTDVRAYRTWIDSKLASFGGPGGNGGGTGPMPTPRPTASVTATPRDTASPTRTPGVPSTGTPIPQPTPQEPSPTPPPTNDDGVAPHDRAALEDGWEVWTAARAGTLGQGPGEIRAKNEGKYTTSVLLVIPNTPAKYKCVQIRGDLQPHGRTWGERVGQYVYYGPIRLSQDANFDAFGCGWQDNGGYWFLH